MIDRLRRETAAWHLRNTGQIRRYVGVRSTSGRDARVAQVIYEGRMGVQRRIVGGAAVVQIELPFDSADIHPGDVVQLDNAAGTYTVESFAPATETRALDKLNCVTRMEAPRDLAV
jgi:hypothetical protein